MRFAPFDSKCCRGFPSRKHEHDDCLQATSIHKGQRNLSDESLPIRRYQPSVSATVLKALPPRLVRSERHWIQDTNHTAADQPVTSSNMEAMNQLSNTLTLRWQNMIFGFLSSRRNKKLRERRITNGQLLTKNMWS